MKERWGKEEKKLWRRKRAAAAAHNNSDDGADRGDQRRTSDQRRKHTELAVLSLSHTTTGRTRASSSFQFAHSSPHPTLELPAQSLIIKTVLLRMSCFSSGCRGLPLISSSPPPPHPALLCGFRHFDVLISCHTPPTAANRSTRKMLLLGVLLFTVTLNSSVRHSQSIIHEMVL